jgi:hypothetical protein
MHHSLLMQDTRCFCLAYLVDGGFIVEDVFTSDNSLVPVAVNRYMDMDMIMVGGHSNPPWIVAVHRGSIMT